MASLAIGAIGAAIGGAIGGTFLGVSAAAIGWSIGSFLGNMLFAPNAPDQQGPRLGELKVQSSAYGSPIPIIYGTARIAGNIIWAKDLKETVNEEDAGGKGGGGGTITTFSYSATFAVALCEGEIDAVRRVWADAVLLYDASDTTGIETIIASNNASKSIKIYSGSESQLAEPLIEADKGAAETPAFRGTSYMVFDDLQLEKFGNRIPNITAEVIVSGAIAPRLVDTENLPINRSAWNCNASFVGENGEIFISITVSTGNTRIIMYNLWLDGSYTIVTENNGSGHQADIIADVPAVARVLSTSRLSVRVFDHINGFYYGEAVFGYGSTITLFHSSQRHQLINGMVYTFDFATMNIMRGELSLGIAFDVQMEVVISAATISANASEIYVTDSFIYTLNNDDTVDIYDLDGALDSTISFTPTVVIGYSSQDIIRVNDAGIIYIFAVGHVHKLENGVYTYVGVVSASASFTGVGSNHLKGDVFTVYKGDAGEVTHVTTNSITKTSGTLSTIQGDICTRAGLDAADFDVTALTDNVDGYVITRPMSARGASMPLQQAFLYDATEKNNKLVFVNRGSASIQSIPEVDLGASIGTDTPDLIQTRQQDAELPSQVIVRYIDIDTDYQQGAQRAQRIDANVENLITLDLAIAMTGTKAKQLAEILLFNSWTEREKFNISLTTEYIALNAADVITVTSDGVSRIMRINQIKYGAVLGIECVSEDLQVYTSSAVAGDPNFPDQDVGLNGPTRLELLDIPLLRNADDDAGMYSAAGGFTDGWSGAAIFKSLDSGITFSKLSDMFTMSKIGGTESTLADAGATLWDRTSTVIVGISGGVLSSVTETQVLQGLNYALIGSEIVQFANATLNVDGTYTLDTFLRGKRGTEWATNTHAWGELFVFLNENALGRIDAQINIERYYKGVTHGDTLEASSDVISTNSGVSDMPLAVSYAKGSRDGSNNLTITWSRRSRYIGTPLWTLPIFEDSESYEVDIISGGSVIRTIAVAAETASYTAAEQTTDGLTLGDPVDVKIYQLSALVGRGYVREETI